MTLHLPQLTQDQLFDNHKQHMDWLQQGISSTQSRVFYNRTYNPIGLFKARTYRQFGKRFKPLNF